MYARPVRERKDEEKLEARLTVVRDFPSGDSREFRVCFQLQDSAGGGGGGGPKKHLIVVNVFLDNLTSLYDRPLEIPKHKLSDMTIIVDMFDCHDSKNLYGTRTHRPDDKLFPLDLPEYEREFRWT